MPGICTSVMTQAEASSGRAAKNSVPLEKPRAHAAPAQHPQEGVAHGGIVVDDEDGMIAHAVLAS